MPKKEEETTAIVTYGEWTPEQMEKESKELSTGGDFWKPPVGNTLVRFLPPKIGWPSPFVIRHQHFIDMPGQERAVTFCCAKMHANKRCIVCQKVDAMEASGNARDAKAARELKPSRGVLANIIVGPKDPESRIVIWPMGKKVFEQLKAIREDGEGGGNFMDPIKGFNITVKRVGTNKDDTQYTLIPSRDLSKLANMDWIEVQVDCRKLIRIPTPEQQKRLLEGEDPRDVWGDARLDRAHGSQRRAGDADAIDTTAIESKAPSRTAEEDLFDDDVDVD